MSKLQNQKPKLLYILKMLLEETDAEHGLSMPQIINRLADQKIPAERKSIYTDFDCLREYGYDVVGEQFERSYVYKIVERDFDLAELKILVDAVQASRFISAGKSATLIEKLKKLTSQYNAEQLQRQVYLAERVKSANESGFGNLDRIHTAIINDSKISFIYMKWTTKKTLEPEGDGARRRVVSPWAVAWADDNYYLVAYDEKDTKIKHFRIDKMKNVAEIDEEREGAELFEKFDLAVYAKKHFGMFGGGETDVTLECDADMAGVIIDRFGKNVEITEKGKGRFTVNVKVCLSDQFLGWVIALGDGVKVTSPKKVVNAMKAKIAKLQAIYK